MQIALGSITIFKILSVKQYINKVLSCLFRSSFPFSNVFYFSSLVKFYPKYPLFVPVISGIVLFPFRLFIVSVKNTQWVDLVSCNCGELIYPNGFLKKFFRIFNSDSIISSFQILFFIFLECSGLEYLQCWIEMGKRGTFWYSLGEKM